MSQLDNPLDAALRARLDEAISDYCGVQSHIDGCVEIGGGSISRTLVAHSESARWFVKLNSLDREPLFAAEADGLAALRACPSLRVPAVVARGVSNGHAYLLLEHLALQPLHDDCAVNAGRALAALHAISGERCGWHCDNFVGSTPQHNAEQPTWPLFFARQRLLPQLELARANGHEGKLIADGERLVDAMPALFGRLPTRISLVHGDLWHGNAGTVARQLALYDPAVYYGDRETDLAMSELFGGFPARFYAAYREVSPLSDGFAQRKTLYNLYHVLNHLNLFGGAYRLQAERMLQSLLAEVG